jgi:hypothetical protein
MMAASLFCGALALWLGSCRGTIENLQTDAGTQRDSGLPGDAGGDDVHDAGLDAGPADTEEPDAGPDGGADDGGEEDAWAGPDVEICDEVVITAQPVPPNVLLVVDRSRCNPDIGAIQVALNAMFDCGESRIRFGWMPMPASASGEWCTCEDCLSGEVEIECSLDSLDQIRGRVDQLMRKGMIILPETLVRIGDYQDLYDQDRKSFVVLITNWFTQIACEEFMNEDLMAQSVSAIGSLFDHGVGTFVIGLGTWELAAELLNQLAEAGGHGRPGPFKYYDALSPEELTEILESISEQTLACDLELDRPPDIPEWLWVYFDGQAVDPDPSHQDGWDYNQELNQVNFYGPTCDLLRSGEVNQVEVRVGCKEPI